MRISGHDRVLHLPGEIGELCTVACDTDEKTPVFVRILLSIFEDFFGYSVELYLESAKCEITLEHRSEIGSSSPCSDQIVIQSEVEQSSAAMHIMIHFGSASESSKTCGCIAACIRRNTFVDRILGIPSFRCCPEDFTCRKIVLNSNERSNKLISVEIVISGDLIIEEISKISGY